MMGIKFDFDNIVSILVREPFRMTKAEIGQLTMRDLIQVYFRPEKKR